MEWVSLKIHGQSFMLHQIRKMIGNFINIITIQWLKFTNTKGLVVTMMRYGIDPSILPKTFEKEKKHIPIAPGIGLFLHRVIHFFFFMTSFFFLFFLFFSWPFHLVKVVFDGYNAKQTRNKGLLLDFKNEIVIYFYYYDYFLDFLFIYFIF